MAAPHRGGELWGRLLLPYTPSLFLFILHRSPLSGRAAARAEPFGRLRVCDARAVLEAFARQNPGYDFHIRLQDELCPRNQGAFHVRDGRVGETAGPCQFELEIARLPSLLFERLEGEKPYFNLKIS